MDSELIALAYALAGGAALGWLFYYGLWVTVKRLATARNPSLLFIGSFAARTTIVLTGFYFLSDGDWKRLVACLCGFTVARLLTGRKVGEARKNMIQAKGNTE